MASVDSGMETGNESNDAPSEAKNENLALIPFSPVGTLRNTLPRGSFASASTMEIINWTDRSRYSLSPLALDYCRWKSALKKRRIRRFSSPLAISIAKAKAKAKELSHDRKIQSLRDISIISKDVDERKLRIAVFTNNIEQVQSYLFAGVNPNCVDSMGRSPLHIASSSGYADIVRLLLENGAEPNQRDRLQNTPLHLAACTNNIVVVTLLLKAGADVGLSDMNERSPLQLAQSKLRLLQKHIGTSYQNNIRNQALPSGSNVEKQLVTIHEIPAFDNLFVTNQALQIVEMMSLFLHNRGQDAEAELLNAFSSRLTLSETKEQVETQVKELLDSLSDLNLTDTKNCSRSSSDNDSSSSSVASRLTP